MEMNAVREVAANMGGSLGSSINISTNAGAQDRKSTRLNSSH